MRKVLMLMLSLFVLCTQLFAQDRTVTGRVTDETGAGVPNASVRVKGTTIGTTTGPDGNFTITVPQSGRTLVVTSVGFADQEISVAGRNTVTVSMRTTQTTMQEVVVTGYTREKKSTFTGAATTLNAEKTVATVPVGAFDQALQGRVPGLLANSGSGQPGSSASIRIRGTNSISGSVTPLYIVDGVPLQAGDVQTMNPNDFESITILKDAQASALYGARGGNGVIVITTKRGKAGAPAFTVRTQYGFTQKPQPSQFEQMNSREMLAYEEFVGGFAPGLVAPGWTYSPKNPAYAALPATSPAATPFAASQARYNFLLDSFRNNNVDYYDLLFKTGTTRNVELNMSGGNAGTRYFTSIGNFNQEGTDRKSKLNRYTLRFNLDNTVGKLNTQLSTTVGYSLTDWNEGSFYAGNGTANPFAMVWRAKPYENPYDKNGKTITGTSSSNSPKAIGNLIERSDESTWQEKQVKANAGLLLSYKLFRVLTLRNNFGLDASTNHGVGFINPSSYVGSLQANAVLPNGGYLNESTFNRMHLINTSGLIFNERFAGKHDVEAGGYFEAIRQWNRGFGFTMYNLDPRLTLTGQNAGQITVNTGGQPTVQVAQNMNSAKSGYGIRSLFGTLRYTFDDRYTLSGNIRRDGTSRILNVENKEITSWAAGFTWNAMRESFMRDQKFLTDAKVRLTYGKVPNIGSIPGGGAYGLSSNFYSVTRYHGAQLPAYGTVNFAGAPGLNATAPSSPTNPDLRIEYVEKTNIGADLGFWANRARLSVDVYKSLTKDLFVSQKMPASSGFYQSNLEINAGSMSNKGVELDLAVDVVRTKNIDVTLRANHAYNKNMIEDLGSVTEYAAGTGIIKEGLPIGTHYSYSYLGADPASGRPIYKRLDGTPTTNINEAGQFHEFGSWLPVHNGGFSAGMRFWRISVDAFFSYQFDTRRYNNVQNWVTQGDATYTGAVTQSRTLLEDQWRKPGDNKMLQSPAFSRQFTSVDITDASFLRFRNLNIAYNIPEINIGKTQLLRSSRFYIQAQNLAIWSRWSGLDPEDDNNISLAEFPNAKAIVVGLDINF